MFRWIYGAMLILSFSVWQLTSVDDGSLTAEDIPTQRTLEKKAEAVSSTVREEPVTFKVTTKKHYLDGVTETTKKQEVIWSMADFWVKYRDWTIVEHELEQMVFSKQVDEISPITEQKGYFGVTAEGELAVFQGTPSEGNIMKSFKPIPLKPLEAKRKLKLEDGIKITSSKHFQQVLSQYVDAKDL
ncbi:intercompartmental signaling factor BofC [Halobacillus shinanisalinarum]|uniref:Intercompartmental signaling factor BofC n=1 Tax=Halobacillus shinanisalinarum TaxID=2932258 RepID=A0ABY4H096_9BACI|nr:BofC C-terminal domain-containing protein [Halobacillus shinanisalinarum]UOQ93853.1 intercompartmental signaling factor BofC [Halobacillus shinanisalinarum]